MVSKELIEQFIQDAFPHADFMIEDVEAKKARLRKIITKQDLRPGNTISGPTLMAMADAALYIAILGETNLQAQAVTTNLNINFLRRPSADVDIIAECLLMKVGKTLITGEVSLHSDGLMEPVAHAVGTYAIL